MVRFDANALCDPAAAWRQMSALRSAIKMFAIGAACAVGLVGLMAYNQESLIYIPRRYTDANAIHYYERIKSGTAGRAQMRVTELRYHTSGGKQLAHYVQLKHAAAAAAAAAADKSVAVPSDIWVMFGGNGALALDHMQFIDDYYYSAQKSTATTAAAAAASSASASRSSFLLVDYPSYGGSCAGRPSPAAILEQSTAAFDALAEHLRWSRSMKMNPSATPEQAEEAKTGGRWKLPAGVRVNVLGHSLGSAAALQFVSHVTTTASKDNLAITRLVCISPFTSIAGMASTLFGPIPGLSYLTASHAWNNSAALQRIATHAEPPLPALTIIHGERDGIVPYWMGKQLAKEVNDDAPHWSSRAAFVTIPGGDHNGIFRSGYTSIVEAMLAAPPPPPPPATATAAAPSAGGGASGSKL